MATPPAEGTPTAERRSGPRAGAFTNVPWEPILQVLGAGAALAAWIAVVGGVRVWARLEAAEVPATQALAVLPRQLLLVEGLQTLVLPVLLGAGVGLLVYLTRPVEQPEPLQERRHKEADEGRSESRTPTSQQEGDEDKQQPSPAKGQQERAARGQDPGGDAEDGEQRDRRRLANIAPLVAKRHLEKEYGTPALIAMTVLIGVGLTAVALAIIEVSWQALTSVVVGALAVGALVAVLSKKNAWRRGVGIFVGLTVAGTIAVLLIKLRIGYVVALLPLTLGAAWLTLAAMVHGKKAGTVAWILFAAVALWAGALGFVRERGQRSPEMDRAEVVLKDGRRITGLYLGRASGDVYLVRRRHRSMTSRWGTRR